MLKEQIFEAVEALRIRKCRPDRETIAHYCTRKFGVQFQEVFTELENIVDQGGLLKVEYKGSTSYRSPGQFDSNSSPLLTKHSKILNSSRTSRLVITAVSELLNENGEWNVDGIPQKELETKLVGFDAERFNVGQMQTILEREIAAGNLVMSKKTKRLFPKDLFPKDDDLNEVSPPGAVGGGRRSASGRAAARRGKNDVVDGEEDGAGTSRAKIGEDEEGRKDVAEKLQAAVRKTYGLSHAKNANTSGAGDSSLTTPEKGSADASSGNASDSSSARTPSPNTRAAGGRQSARNKRKKEVFDPSDPPPVKQRTRHGSENKTICKVCDKQVEAPKATAKGGDGRFVVTCTVCSCQYHTACVPDALKGARAPKQEQATPLAPPTGGRRSTRRSAAAAATPAAPPPQPAAPLQPWTCPACKECDICGGGGNKAIGEEDLIDYSCSNPKCDQIVILHEGCIAGAAEEVRKCIKCGVGIVGPVGAAKEETKQQEEEDGVADVEVAVKKGKGGKRGRGGAAAASKAASPVKTSPPAKKAKVAPAVAVEEEAPEVEAPVPKADEDVVKTEEKPESEPETVPEAVTAATDKTGAPEDQNSSTPAAGAANFEPESQTVDEEKAEPAVAVASEATTENGVTETAKITTEFEANGAPPAAAAVDEPKSAPAPPAAGEAEASKGGTSAPSEDEGHEDLVEVFTLEEAASASPDRNGSGLHPDPTKAQSWSPREVEAYFHSKGLLEEGTVFRDQEIDGVALLLMRREDIVHGMKFLLGPALKIYRLIVELQKLG